MPVLDYLLDYKVEMPHPESHLFVVTLRIQSWAEPTLNLKMPVWTPGSYLVREYARHVQSFTAHGNSSLKREMDGQIDQRMDGSRDGSTNNQLAWAKVAKNHWVVQTSDQTELTIIYKVFANELTVRTNHLDSSHGYFNGAALFFYIPGQEKQAIRVAIALKDSNNNESPTSDWIVTTPLEPLPDKSFTYQAKDYDTLVDSPFEIGKQTVYKFTAIGKPHELAIWGAGNLKPEQVIRDTQKIIEVESAIFGGLPYDRYTFLLHLTANGFGGLEHKNSCSLIYPRFGFRSPEKYQQFMQLVAHEFFHLWNIKRIRPKALEVFDYEQENYTPSLWFSEGTTSYYDLLIPLRAGIYNAKTFLANLSKEITRLQTTPGRLLQSAEESSFDAWIKLYRRDAHSDNSQISYYLKGELISLLLDLLIRLRHGNQRSLDDVLRSLWQQFGQTEVGFTPQDLQQIISEVAGLDLTDFWQSYIEGVEELPLGEYLAPFGLQLVSINHPTPYWGMLVKTEGGREMIKFVEAGSPAEIAGIAPGDELLAIDGIRVSAEHLSVGETSLKENRLQDYQAGAMLKLTLFHGDLLRTVPLTLAPPRPHSYQVLPLEKPTAIQSQNFYGWLGVALESII